jgi:hypothetical protein
VGHARWNSDTKRLHAYGHCFLAIDPKPIPTNWVKLKSRKEAEKFCASANSPNVSLDIERNCEKDTGKHFIKLQLIFERYSMYLFEFKCKYHANSAGMNGDHLQNLTSTDDIFFLAVLSKF